MYIIKHRSRRTKDSNGTFYWVVCGSAHCSTIEAAVEILMELVNEPDINLMRIK